MELKVNFYADTPKGHINKLFVYKIKSYDHAIDLVSKFVQEYKCKIRAAYFVNENGLSIRFDNIKEYNLSTWQNTQNDKEKMIRIIETHYLQTNYFLELMNENNISNVSKNY